MSEHKTNKPVATVVETTTARTKLRDGMTLRNLNKVIIGLLVVGLLVGAGVFFMSRQKQSDASDKPAPQKQYSVAELQQMQDTNRNPDELVKVMEGQEGDNTQKRLLLANAYVRDKQYDKAFAIYDDMMAKNQLSFGYLQGAAEYAETYTQDYPRALKYYQAAKKVAEADTKNEMRENNIANVNGRIKTVQDKIAGKQ